MGRSSGIAQYKHTSLLSSAVAMGFCFRLGFNVMGREIKFLYLSLSFFSLSRCLRLSEYTVIYPSGTTCFSFARVEKYRLVINCGEFGKSTAVLWNRPGWCPPKGAMAVVPVDNCKVRSPGHHGWYSSHISDECVS